MFTSANFSIENIDIPAARKVKRHGQARHLTEENLAELFDALPDERWRCVFALAYFTGSRISEVLSLDVSDIGADSILIRRANTKTKKTRTVAITPGLRAFLDAYDMPESGYAFPARHNSKGKGKGHITRQAADRTLREACQMVGLDGVSTHSFRRSFATNLHSQGISLAKISRLLGHESAQMTARYIE